MRFYVLALASQHLVHLLYCCWAQINGKKKKTSHFSLNIFIAFYYWRMAVCVFLLRMIETDMFNNNMREQQVILEVKLE